MRNVLRRTWSRVIARKKADPIANRRKQKATCWKMCLQRRCVASCRPLQSQVRSNCNIIFRAWEHRTRLRIGLGAGQSMLRFLERCYDYGCCYVQGPGHRSRLRMLLCVLADLSSRTAGHPMTAPCNGSCEPEGLTERSACMSRTLTTAGCSCSGWTYIDVSSPHDGKDGVLEPRAYFEIRDTHRCLNNTTSAKTYRCTCASCR